MVSYPIQTGKFYTEEDRPWQDSDQSDILATHTFLTPYIYYSPKIIMGLNMMDLAPGERTIGVKSSAEEIDLDTFQSRISIWGDGKMTAAGCTWLETAARNPNIKSGVCRTTRRSGRSFKIEFDKAFVSTPTVLVWLGGFQMDMQHDWDVGGWAESVKPTGFTLNVRTGKNTVLHQSTFSWVAFVESAEVCGGRVCEIAIPAEYKNMKEPRSWPGVVNFPSTFEDKPRVALGVSRISTNNQDGMRIKFPVVDVDTECMRYEVATWWYTAIEAAEISWVAVG